MPEVYGFGYDGAEPVPARPEALAYAQALTEFMEANQELEKARESVPDYTGQWSSKDYYANELERYYRAADALADATKGLF